MISELDFTIPPDIIHCSLPSHNLSIRGFLGFDFPQSKDKTPGFKTQEVCISFQAPDATPTNIKAILAAPAPSPTLLQDLVACLMSSHALAPLSLACQEVQSMEVKSFPLWLLTYWTEVNCITDIRECWSQAD
jgi:hypothetical protein